MKNEEKIVRRKLAPSNPKTASGCRMAALLEKGQIERRPLLSDAQIDRVLKERRGRNY